MRGIRSWTSATSLFGSVITIAHDWMFSLPPCMPHVVQAGEGHELPVPAREVVGLRLLFLVALISVVPFLIARCGNKAARALECFAEKRLLSDRLRTRVERCRTVPGPPTLI